MTSTRWFVCVACILFCAASPIYAAGKYFEVEYPASKEPGKLIFDVTYTVWIPDGVTKLRGVIVHQHGCGTGACKGGQTSAYDLHWQALAKKWDCALLGPYYHQVDGQECRQWCDPRNGSEETFLRCLADLSDKSQHPELKEVPWCLWGHSGGSFWASIMQTLHPKRIVAIWFRSGTAFAAWEKGEIPKPTIPPAAYQIPMILNPGIKEKGDARFSGAWTGSMAMYHAYRAAGAPAAFAPDPRGAHECADSRYLAIPFFDECLEMRLPAKDATDQKLKPVTGGMLSIAGTDQSIVDAEAPGGAKNSMWIPNELSKGAWMEYFVTGSVSDKTPPPAPLSVKVSVNADKQVEITWDAEADFESGIQAFIIQRDGKDIAQVPEKPIGRFGRPLFQTMSYHDTPEAPLPEMKFIDKSADPNGKSKYEVITVNSVGLKSSPKSSD